LVLRGPTSKCREGKGREGREGKGRKGEREGKVREWSGGRWEHS